jgi:hypothetical protein
MDNLEPNSKTIYKKTFSESVGDFEFTEKVQKSSSPKTLAESEKSL